MKELQVGNIIELKKKHPCGSYEWEILRTGADFKLKCRGCGHMIGAADSCGKESEGDKIKDDFIVNRV